MVWNLLAMIGNIPLFFSSQNCLTFAPCLQIPFPKAYPCIFHSAFFFFLPNKKQVNLGFRSEPFISWLWSFCSIPCASALLCLGSFGHIFSLSRIYYISVYRPHNINQIQLYIFIYTYFLCSTRLLEGIHIFNIILTFTCTDILGYM